MTLHTAREDKRSRNIAFLRGDLDLPWYLYLPVGAVVYGGLVIGLNMLIKWNQPGFEPMSWLKEHWLFWMIAGGVWALSMRGFTYLMYLYHTRRAEGNSRKGGKPG